MTTQQSGPGVAAREEILARVRGALGTTDAHPGGLPPVEIAREYAGAGTSTLTRAQIVDLFVERVEDYRAEVMRVPGAQLVSAVEEALDGAARVVVPNGVEVGWLAGVESSRVVRDTGLSAAELDRVAAVLTGAAVGVAVTGTIVLDHGPDQGRRALSLVPDLHVCVLAESQLVADVPDAVAHLAAAQAAGRPLTWISGPSATSDIELERVEGVHGPRTLRVILVEG